MFAGLLPNPYAGLVVFVALPALFLAGLLLIPLGIRLERRRLARTHATPSTGRSSTLPSRASVARSWPSSC